MDTSFITSILTIATAMSPLAVIALSLIVIFMLVKKETAFKLFKGRRDERDERLTTIENILNKIATNHLHELPDMRKDVASILLEQKDTNKTLNEQGQRLARVEGVLKININ